MPERRPEGQDEEGKFGDFNSEVGAYKNTHGVVHADSDARCGDHEGGARRDTTARVVIVGGSHRERGGLVAEDKMRENASQDERAIYPSPELGVEKLSDNQRESHGKR